MDITYYNHDEGIQILTELLMEGKLTPIIGAGFTAGSKSKGGRVLNGSEATDKMKEMINEVNSSIDLTQSDFNETSKYFYKLVSKEQRDRFFEKYFTRVKLEQDLVDFLALPWSYIYTLNVDDAIEKTELYFPVYPYLDPMLAKKGKSTRLVYKLHGDAAFEIAHNLEDNIVFSYTQYIKFLNSTKNTTIINAIQSDYKQKNLLYIGCGLKSEPDLEYIYEAAKSEVPVNGMRMVLRSGKVTSNEELNLESYGINTIIVVKSYREFYLDFVRVYKKLEAETKAELYPFSNPEIMDVSADQQKTLEYFSGKDIFHIEENRFYKSGMHITRSVISVIENALKSTNAVILQGRRFSGKTNVLCTLAERSGKYEVLYFPSNTVCDEELIEQLLSKKKNALFLFDSNSLSEGAYQKVAYSFQQLQENGNKLVIAVNSNDALSLSDTLNAEIIYINYKFKYGSGGKFEEPEEIDVLNRAADKYGLIHRDKSNTNIDYLKRIIDEQKVQITLPFSTPDGYSKSEKMILFLLCVHDKLYYGDISVFGIKFRDVDTLLGKMNGIIEKKPVSKKEKSHHSTEKLVHNSKYVLLSIMNEFASNDIVEIVMNTVRSTVGDKTKERLYVEAVLFDTLNQLFGRKSGAGNTIYKIYDELEPLLNNNMDYWLQRAKSIYRYSPDNKEKLLDAYRYATKAYHDGNQRLRSKAALTLSLTCCLLSSVSENEEEKNQYELEAIDYAYEAVTSDDFQKRGNASLYAAGQKQKVRHQKYYDTILKICEKQEDKNEDANLLLKTSVIKEKLSYRKNQKPRY